MVDSRYRQQYQPRYGTGKEAEPDGSGTPVPILVDNLGVDGQITTLRIHADNAVEIQVTVDAINTGEDPVPFKPTVATAGDPTTKLQLSGGSSYTIGDFENPALEVGAFSQISVEVVSDQTGDGNVAVNARIDERTG